MMLTQQMGALASNLTSNCRVTAFKEKESKTTLRTVQYKMAGCPALEKLAVKDERQLGDYYYRYKEIGSGGFGSVYSGKCKRTNRGVAIKSIAKKKICGWSMVGNQLVPNEVALHRRLEHKYIIKFLDYFEDQDKYHIITEKPDKYIDLFDYVTDKGQVSERSARYLFQQVLEAVQYCLSMGVFHRDVKDENILIDLDSNQVKLIDFGSGTWLHDEVYTEFEGTMEYSPPEWVLDKYYRAIPATVWSLGILLYNMLLGDTPFQTKSDIAAARLSFYICISDEAESLIRWMLAVNPQERPSIDQIFGHPWLTKSSSSPSTSSLSSMSSPAPSSLNNSASSHSTSSLSSTDSNDPGSGYTHFPSTSPGLKRGYDQLQSSSTATGMGKLSTGLSQLTCYSPRSPNQSSLPSQSATGMGKLSSGLSQLTCYSPRSPNQTSLPSQSAVSAVALSPMPCGGIAPIRRYYLRSFAKRKSPASHSPAYQSDSTRSLKLWKTPSTSGGNGL